MPSHPGVRRTALRVFLSLLVVFLSAATLRAQGKKVTSSASTTGNASWDQAIAALQAQVDLQAQTIAQLQAALAAETTARQFSATSLETAINNEAAARQAAVG